MTSHIIVAAIDFGTTYSSWAFSFKHEFESDPVAISTKTWKGQTYSEKAPTCILISPEKKFHSFGYVAEKKFDALAGEDKHKPWYFFRRFKMMLFDKQGLSRNDYLTDVTGKQLSANTVFSQAIEYLKNDLLETAEKRLGTHGITINDILWVLTVPAIWNDAAKQFMREAAEEAGIARDKLKIALEPEAASIYCRHLKAEQSGKDQTSLSTFGSGKKYLILDAGGGTVDITVHEVVQNGKLKELYKATGGAWGGTKVDDAFLDFLTSILGFAVMAKFKETCVEDFTDLLRDFEVKKREIDPKTGVNEKITIRMSAALRDVISEMTDSTFDQLIKKSHYSKQVSLTAGKLRIEHSVAKGFFDSSVSSIIKHVEELLCNCANHDLDAIVMVGGFSESNVLEDAVRVKFSPKYKIIVPYQACLAVLKGAVIFGHSPSAISQRVSKYTYGTDIIGNIFSTLVESGQTVVVGEAQQEQKYVPVFEGQREMSMNIYASKEKNPKLITDAGCHKIGDFSIPIQGMGSVSVKMIFGGTEIDVECKHTESDAVHHLKVDFLT